MKEKLPMPALLRAHLRRRDPNHVIEHCDAETLTAFAECTLRAKEREQVAHHLSLCPDCREVLALAIPTTIPALNSKRHPANTRLLWLYSAAALVTLCLAALLFPSSKPPASTPPPQQPMASLNPSLTDKSLIDKSLDKSAAPNTTFSPHLTAAKITAAVLTGINPIWRVNTSHYPATLEISYDHRTWRTIHTPALQPKSVAWESTDVWVANGDGTVLQSTDNGLHWTHLRPAIHLSPTH